MAAPGGRHPGRQHASASVVTPARSRRARFGHVQLVALLDGALLVLVLGDGNVVQRRLDRNRARALAAGRASNRRHSICRRRAQCRAGRPGRAPGRRGSPSSRRSPRTWPAGGGTLLEEADSVVVEEVFTDGIVNVLEQPEFAEARSCGRSSRCSSAPTSWSSWFRS